MFYKLPSSTITDMNIGQNSQPEHSDEVTEEGIRIVEDLLRKWAQSTSSDGEDVVMEDISPEVQLEELRRCVEEFRPQIQRNAWVQSLITSL